jgi:predicted transcriptional regulator
MATATTQAITLHLPQDLVERVRQAAQERRETPDEIVAEALRFSLQPVRQEALRRLKHQVDQQGAQPEAQIRTYLEARLTAAEQKRLSWLLERNRDEGLTAEEQAELQGLFDRIEEVATEKAAAMWLLADKGPDAVR